MYVPGYNKPPMIGGLLVYTWLYRSVMETVFSFLENLLSVSLEYLLSYFLLAVSGQAVEHHSVIFSNSHKVIIYLIAGESLLTLFSFALLAHRSPYVSDKYISVLSGSFGVIDHFKLVTVSSRKVENLLRRLIVIRASDRNAHTNLETADNEGVSHVITIADKAHFKTGETALEFTDSHKVSEYLTGVAEVSKTVYYRDTAVFSEVLYLFLFKSTDHDTAEVA